MLSCISTGQIMSILLTVKQHWPTITSWPGALPVVFYLWELLHFTYWHVTWTLQALTVLVHFETGTIWHSCLSWVFLYHMQTRPGIKNCGHTVIRQMLFKSILSWNMTFTVSIKHSWINWPSVKGVACNMCKTKCNLPSLLPTPYYCAENM